MDTSFEDEEVVAEELMVTPPFAYDAATPEPVTEPALRVASAPSEKFCSHCELRLWTIWALKASALMGCVMTAEPPTPRGRS